MGVIPKCIWHFIRDLIPCCGSFSSPLMSCEFAAGYNTQIFKTRSMLASHHCAPFPPHQTGSQCQFLQAVSMNADLENWALFCACSYHPIGSGLLGQDLNKNLPSLSYKISCKVHLKTGTIVTLHFILFFFQPHFRFNQT